MKHFIGFYILAQASAWLQEADLDSLRSSAGPSSGVHL